MKKAALIGKVLRTLNAPMPAWAVVLLLMGGTAVAAVPVFNGSLNVTPGGTIVDTNATASSCIGTSPSKQYAYGSNCVSSVGAGSNITVTAGATPTVAVTAAPTFTGTISANKPVTGVALSWLNGVSGSTQISVSASKVTGVTGYAGMISQSGGSNLIAFDNSGNAGFAGGGSFNGTTTIQANGVGAGLDHGFQFTNTASSVGTVPQSIDVTSAYAANINTGCASTQPVFQQWDGLAGATATNYGGYHVFFGKSDGSCSGNEVLVLTAGQHIYPAGPAINSGSSTAGCSGHDNQGICQITTPATCSASVPCGTVTVTFGTPFYNTNGTTTQMPYCFFTVQDTNLATNAWVPVPETIAYDHIVVGYAPLVAQATARTLNIMYRCNASIY